MKKPQSRTFKLNPIAAAIAVAMASQFAVQAAHAGSGYGSGTSALNAPVAIPTYYANSPSGPAPQWVNGVLQIRGDGSALPATLQSGTPLRKFVDTLPGFGPGTPGINATTNVYGGANALGQYIPVATPEKWVDPNGIVTGDDYYEIAAVEFREKLHSDLPATGTHLRGYVQLATPALTARGLAKPFTTLDGRVLSVVDLPHHLGPVISATKGTTVRVKFTNYLPAGGKLFLPYDETLSGAGFGPDGATKYGQNRAGMHLVGGQAPWISAGSPNQWIAPAIVLTGAAIDATGKIVTATPTGLVVGAPVSGGGFPAGTTIASVSATGFTTSAASATPGVAGVTLTSTDSILAKGASAQTASDMLDPGTGSVNLVFPNDMSARFSFIQDRTSGMTRLNAYAGLEAGYIISDPIEQGLIASGAIPAAQIPLIIEDKTFVPANILQQDAKWTDPNWGGTGDLWFPHVYETNQSDATGINGPALSGGSNPVGRWDFGPLFWPIFPVHPAKSVLPSPTFVPEAYMDTPLVNGTAYPTLTVDPKAYRLRILNASNDRYVNLGLYKADPTPAPLLDLNGNPVVNSAGVVQNSPAGLTEVKMVPAAAVDAAGSPPGWDPVAGVQLPLPQYASLVDAAGNPLFPWNIHAEPSGPTRAWPVDGRAGGSPDPTMSGPDFLVIGNDGGLLPQATDIPSQPVTYEQNRRSITVTNIYGYGLLLGPSERADTIVDFSQYAGQTLILFNDAPAPTPFIDPRNDYYTGDPDQTAQGGAYTTQPGYGPNTRTIMQIKVTGTIGANGTAFNALPLATALPAAYAASQPAPIVTESVYNAAFGSTNTDTFGRVATGSAAQPSLLVNHSAGTGVTINGFSLVTSGGAGTGSGSGYTTPPAVQLVGGGGTGATASATINAAGQVATVSLTSAGSNYTSAPSVIFVPNNSISGVTVNDGGAGYTSPVAVTLSGGGLTGVTPVSATVTLSTSTGVSTAAAGSPGAATVTSAGSGYLVPPTVSFVPPPSGTAATGVATISTSPLFAGPAILATAGTATYTNPVAVVSASQNGTTATASPIVAFSLATGAITFATPVTSSTSVGAGFDPGSVQLNFAPALTQNAAVTAILPAGSVQLDTNGAATSITITAAGSGLTVAPIATISDGFGNSAVVPVTLAPATGQILGATITNGGTGYTAPATISFTDATGSGATFTANPANPVFGTVTGLTITSAGSGYVAAPQVVFTDKTTGLVHPAGATAAANVYLATSAGAIVSVNGVSLPPAAAFANGIQGFTSAPTISFAGGAGGGALATVGIAPQGVGAQATVITSTTTTIPVLTKAEQELYDDYGRYNSTGGVELPFTTAAIQTTIPLNYIDQPTEILGDDELQVWKLVDNGFWSNSIHFSGWDVQLVNRVGWDGTVKPPASNEVGWKDTVRLNPLEDAIVAMRAKAPNVNFGQPRSKRLLDPSRPAGTGNFPVAPAQPVAGTPYASGLGFTADPNVVTQAGTMNSAVVGTGKILLATSTNTDVLAGSTTGNFDNEFTWGSAILGHSENDFTRPVVFNPLVTVPLTPGNFGDTTGTGKLTWTDPTPVGQLASAPGVLPVLAATAGNPQNEIGFKLLQAPLTLNAVGKYVAGAFTPAATPFAAVPANVTSYTEPAALVSPTPPNGQFYAYEVVAFNAAGDSAPSSPWNESPPDAPTALTLSPAYAAQVPATTTDVKLTANWSDNAINETSYVVTRTGPSLTAPVGGKVTGAVTTYTAPANTAPISANTVWVDPGLLTEGSWYEYDVVAHNSFGDSKPVLSATIQAPVYLPAAPSNLIATPQIVACPAAVPVQCAPDDVKLTWLDNAVNETSYQVWRNGALLATVPGNANNVSGVTLSYTDTTAQEGTAYTYLVNAINAVGPSAQAGTTPTPFTLSYVAATQPTNAIATPATAPLVNGVYPDTLALTWNENAYTETSYQITRSVAAVQPNAQAAPLVASIPTVTFTASANGLNNPFGTKTAGWTASPTASFADSGLIDGVAYTYTIAGVNSVGVSTATATVTKTMPGVYILPPSNLLATPNRAGSSIGLQWVDNSSNETDFLVEEQVSMDGGVTFGAWTALPPIARSAAQSAAQGGLVNYTRANVPTTRGYVYNFRVSARNLANFSDSHPYLTAQASLDAPVLTAAPTLAVPTFNAATRRVTLNWTAVTPPAGTTIRYIVTINGLQLRTAALTYSYRPTAAALTAAGGINYSVQAVATAIRVANPTVFGSTTGPASNVQNLKVTILAAPATLTASAPVAGGGGVTSNLTWTAVTGATGYVITPTLNGVAQAVINVAGGATVARTVNMVAGNTYTYTVAATNLAGTGTPTAAVTVNTPAAANTAVTAAANVGVGSGIKVTWTNTSSNLTATPFTVQRRVGAGAWATITPTITQTGTSFTFTDTTVVSGTTYSYHILASGAGGNSAYSAATAGVRAP